jgi:hypothetical protein
MIFVSLVYQELRYVILEDFLGQHNENIYERRANQAHLHYEGGMFGISRLNA